MRRKTLKTPKIKGLDPVCLLPGEEGGHTVFVIEFYDGCKYFGYTRKSVVARVASLMSESGGWGSNAFVREHGGSVPYVVRCVASNMDQRQGRQLRDLLVARAPGDVYVAYGDPVQWVISRNLHRRHLNGLRRASCVSAALEWAKQGQQQAMHTERAESGQFSPIPANIAGIGEPVTQDEPENFNPEPEPVDGQRKCPAKWPAKMSLVLLAMITDGSYSTRSRFMGGLRASMYFFAVSRWMPSSRATPRVDNPLRFAF